MRSIRNAIHNPYAASRSMGVRLLLYWSAMALLLVATILSILMATGVLSHPARQLAGALDIQQRNTYAALDAQMGDLTARGVALSEKLGRELDAFLAAKGIPFDALNDDPGTIAELEKRLYAPLSSTLSATSCSGSFFCLNVTANTSLPDADALRAGLYLRYSGLQPTVASEQDVICFRGAAEASRGLQLQMHNRWNPELNTALIPGSERVLSSQATRPAEGSLWTKRSELSDTWEHVMLLCVPILDSSGAVRGFCGVEISDLYFSLSHDTVSSSYGNMLTLLAPIDGDRLDLSGAMLGATSGSRLTADGTLHIEPGKYYTTYTDGRESYLGRHRLLDAVTSDGIPLAAVTLVSANAFRSYERGVQSAWLLGSLLFLLAMLAVSAVLSRRFVKPINESLAAVRGGTTEVVASGIPEIDELLAMIRARPVGALPPDVEARLCGFAERAGTLTGMERTILQYYMGGYETLEVLYRSESGDPILLFVSNDLGTVPTDTTELLLTDSHPDTLSWYPIPGIVALPYDSENERRLAYDFTFYSQEGNDGFGSDIGWTCPSGSQLTQEIWAWQGHTDKPALATLELHANSSQEDYWGAATFTWWYESDFVTPEEVYEGEWGLTANGEYSGVLMLDMTRTGGKRYTPGETERIIHDGFIVQVPMAFEDYTYLSVDKGQHGSYLPIQMEPDTVIYFYPW